MLMAYVRLMRLNRPIGTFLVLWPALWGLWLAAGGMPEPRLLVIFALGALLVRSAGCIINDYADRDIDGGVARTRDRPLATGEIPVVAALALFGVLMFLAFLLVLFTNGYTIALALLAAALTALYPFTKRYTNLPQIFLGAAFACAVPMAFAATNGEVPRSGWLLYVVVLVWTVTYDTFYAMVDRDDDLKLGVRSLAVLFGELDRPMTAILQALVIAGLLLVGARFELGGWYHLGVAAATGLFAWQQYLIRNRERDGAFAAFMNNNWVGVAVWLGIVAHYWAAA